MRLPAKSGTFVEKLALLADGERHFEAVRAAEMEVFFAVARRSVHEAGAGIGGDMLAGKQRHVEIVAVSVQRMRADHALAGRRR